MAAFMVVFQWLHLWLSDSKNQGPALQDVGDWIIERFFWGGGLNPSMDLRSLNGKIKATSIKKN